MDLAANEKDVHADFYNGKFFFFTDFWIIDCNFFLDFDDLFDEDDEQAA